MPAATLTDVLTYARDFLGTEPDHIFDKHPTFGALRHDGSKKWFGLVMRLNYGQVNVDKPGELDAMNVKAEPELIDALVARDGFVRGYHMNKRHWVTVFLDGSVGQEDALDLLHGSFRLTAGR